MVFLEPVYFGCLADDPVVVDDNTCLTWWIASSKMARLFIKKHISALKLVPFELMDLQLVAVFTDCFVERRLVLVHRGHSETIRGDLKHTRRRPEQQKTGIETNPAVLHGFYITVRAVKVWHGVLEEDIVNVCMEDVKVHGQSIEDGVRPKVHLFYEHATSIASFSVVKKRFCVRVTQDVCKALYQLLTVVTRGRHKQQVFQPVWLYGSLVEIEGHVDVNTVNKGKNDNLSV